MRSLLMLAAVMVATLSANGGLADDAPASPQDSPKRVNSTRRPSLGKARETEVIRFVEEHPDGSVKSMFWIINGLNLKTFSS